MWNNDAGRRKLDRNSFRNNFSTTFKGKTEKAHISKQNFLEFSS